MSVTEYLRLTMAAEHMRWSVTLLQHGGSICTLGVMAVPQSRGKTVRAGGEGEYPVYGANGVVGYTDAWTHEGNFVLVGSQGSVERDGHPIVHVAHGKFATTGSAIILKPADDVLLTYLAHLLSVQYIAPYVTGSGIKGLRWDRITSIPVVKPTLKDQERIAGVFGPWREVVDRCSDDIQHMQGAVQERYEWVRDKLLNLKPLANTM